MNGRETILAAIARNQPPKTVLPDLSAISMITFTQEQEQFIKVVENIGGTVITIHALNEISSYITEHFKEGHNLVTTMDGIPGLTKISHDIDPHELETVEFAVLPAVFGVAENGAVWLSEKEMGIRVLPFIVQHLAVVLHAGKIVPHMHAAYEQIGSTQYSFGSFIAGPSKTADIEQSLVLGAHGPRSMTVFLVTE